MPRELKHPRARVPDLMAKYGLTGVDVAIATDTDKRSVRRWKDQTGERRSRTDQYIRNLERVVSMLDGIVTTASVRVWLREPNPLLNYRTPLEVLGEGNLEAVEAAVRALK